MIALRRTTTIVPLFALLVGLLPAAALAQDQRCFGETNQCISGQIWNNNESDPGALYNPQGQLVSYWPR